MSEDVRSEAIDRVLQAISSVLMKEGRLIEVGFRSFILHHYTDGVPTAAGIPIRVSEEQYKALRLAFFSGAQHLFGSVLRGMGDSAESTDADLRKVELIISELGAFVAEVRRRNGISGGPPQTHQ